MAQQPTAELAARLGSLKASLDLTLAHCRGDVNDRIKADYATYAKAFPTEFTAAVAAREAELKQELAAAGTYKFCLQALELYGPRGREVRGAWQLR